MTQQLDERRRSVNGWYVPPRRRSVDWLEVLARVLIGGGFAVSALVVLALGMGCVWLIVWLSQDIARRLVGG